ncbi:MAG: DUF1566 domain-containing protein [bacterium]|nr:DUF1566 domain-containing protein [bacterium]
MKKARKFYKRQVKIIRLYFKRHRESAISITLVILISFLAWGTSMVRAGSLTPPGAPAASGYTLGDIYVRLTTNASAVAGNHDLATTTSPAGTFYTLTQIYDAIPAITANTVKLGTSYLGVAGSLIPSGGTATTSDVLLGKTYFGADQADWILATGAYNASNLTAGTVKSGVAFGAGLTGDYPSAAFPLSGDTGATDATAAEICNTNEAWTKAGALLTGSLNPTAATILSGTTICGVAGTAVANPTFGDNDAAKVLTTAGNAGTFNAANLTAANVRNGIAFGVGLTGTFSGNLAYGDDSAANVLTIAATPGTFNVANLANNLIKQGTTWGVSLGSTGTLTPDGGTAAAADLFNAKTANLTADWDLDTGTLNLACNTAAFNGAGNLVADGYDGAGNGTNRWCMGTSTASAIAGDIALYKSAWVNGLEINGTFASSTKIAALEGEEVTPDAGGWLSKVTVAITNLIAGVIKSGETVGGVAGTLLPEGGTATAADVASGKTFFGSTQANWTLQTGAYDPWTNQKNQTKDDWVNSGGTTGEYTGEEATWSAVSGSPFAGYDGIDYTIDSNIVDLKSGIITQDTRTGLWWSDIMALGATATTTTNIFTLTADGSRPTGGNAIGFCDALNSANFASHNDWYLPTQKELQQAYIDGSANNLPNPGYTFWSSTETYLTTATAWFVNLPNGPTFSSPKTTSYYVRCVRR